MPEGQRIELKTRLRPSIYAALGRTCNLDDLAARGTLFRYGYATASVCRPALLSLLTGLHPLEVHARSGVGVERYYTTSRDPDAKSNKRSKAFMERLPTLPRILAEHGYVSLQAGKFWEGDYRSSGFSSVRNPNNKPCIHHDRILELVCATRGTRSMSRFNGDSRNCGLPAADGIP